MWLKFIKFNYLLPKIKFFVVWLVKIQDLLGWQQDFIIQPYYVEVASAMKISHSQCTCCKALYFYAVTHRLHHPRNQAKISTDHPQQKLSILLLKPRHFTICCRISSFDKISIKSSKKCDLLATLMKFNQASNPHLPRQQNFVKKHSICAT